MHFIVEKRRVFRQDPILVNGFKATLKPIKKKKNKIGVRLGLGITMKRL